MFSGGGQCGDERDRCFAGAERTTWEKHYRLLGGPAGGQARAVGQRGPCVPPGAALSLCCCPPACLQLAHGFCPAGSRRDPFPR